MNNRGFTILEVIVAIVILSMGLIALAGTAGSVARMVGRSQQYNKAAALAAERFEILRGTATPTATITSPCASLAGGSSTSGNYSVSWTIADVTNGKQVTITVTSPTARGTRTNTFTQILTCQI